VKRLLFVLAVGALVVGASGCDLSPPAATVNGASISQSTLNDELSRVIDNANTQCATQLQSGLTTSPVGVGTADDGTTPNAVATNFADTILQTLVLRQLEEQTLAERGVKVTPADVTAAIADYESQLQGQLSQAQSANTAPAGCALSTSKSVSSQLPRDFLQSQGTSLADQEMVEVVVGHVSLSQAALQAYYHAHLAEVTLSCLNVVVSDTLAGAQRLHDEIAAGASFTAASNTADVDKQESPSGGQLPCEYPSQVTGQFGATDGPTVNALATGQLAAPAPLSQQSSSGAAVTYYVVVQMRQHQLVPFATLRNSIREAILEAHSSVVESTLAGLVSRAHVSVDPRYGQWSLKHGVTVPTPPPPAFVLNADANVPLEPVSLRGLTANTPAG
jgi:hypothetical protein